MRKKCTKIYKSYKVDRDHKHSQTQKSSVVSQAAAWTLPTFSGCAVPAAFLGYRLCGFIFSGKRRKSTENMFGYWQSGKFVQLPNLLLCCHTFWGLLSNFGEPPPSSSHMGAEMWKSSLWPVRALSVLHRRGFGGWCQRTHPSALSRHGSGEALSERSECSRNEPHPHLLRWL